jgi:hypothetical protein
MKLEFIAALAGAILVAQLAVMPSAQAQSRFQASPGLANLRLDLDTEGGNFSSLQMSPCGLNAIRATITMPRLGNNARWLPVTSIAARAIAWSRCRSGVAQGAASHLAELPQPECRYRSSIQGPTAGRPEGWDRDRLDARWAHHCDGWR